MDNNNLSDNVFQVPKGKQLKINLNTTQKKIKRYKTIKTYSEVMEVNKNVNLDRYNTKILKFFLNIH